MILKKKSRIERNGKSLKRQMNQEIQNNFIVEPFKANLIMGKIVDENIKKQLDKSMDFFYGETKYAPVTKLESTEDDPMASEDLNQKVQYLQGQLTAMKEAYRFLLDSLSTNGSSNSLRQAALLKHECKIIYHDFTKGNKKK